MPVIEGSTVRYWPSTETAGIEWSSRRSASAAWLTTTGADRSDTSITWITPPGLPPSADPMITKYPSSTMTALLPRGCAAESGMSAIMMLSSSSSTGSNSSASS